MLAAEDFVARCTTFAITARVFFGLEVGCIARWCAVMSDSVPIAATRGRSTLSIGVSRFEISVLSSLVVIRRGGKGNGGKGSSDDNEDLHSVKKNNKMSTKTRADNGGIDLLENWDEKSFEFFKKTVDVLGRLQGKRISRTLSF